MCTPLAIGLTGAAIAGAGQIVSGVQQSRAAEFNARSAEVAAQNEASRLAFENQQARRRGERLRGTQRARFAAAGVQLAGTPLEVLADTAAEEELQVQANQFGSNVRQGQLRDSARLSRQQGSGALFGSILGGAGTVIGGAANAQRLGFGQSPQQRAAAASAGIPDPFFIGGT